MASAPADARRLISQLGSHWGVPNILSDDAALVAEALVLESVRRARSPLLLTATRLASSVLIEVEDSCVSFPDASQRWESGLEGVGRIAAAYGFVRRPAGRQLWARLDAADAAITEGDAHNGSGTTGREFEAALMIG